MDAEVISGGWDKAPPDASGLIPPRSIGGLRSTQQVVAGASAAMAVTGAMNSYAPLAYMLPFQTLDYLEMIAQYNPDYSQAIENIKTLANSGYNILVTGAKRTSSRVQNALMLKSRTVQTGHGGIPGLIDKLLRQAATYGAIAGEWIVSEDLSDVVDFADINPKLIRFFWEDNHWAPYQKVTMFQVNQANALGQKVRNGCYVKLNEVTFHYYGFNSAPMSPYGVPPFLAALPHVSTQQDMLFNMAQVVKKVGMLGIVDIVIKSLTTLPGETAEAFKTRATSYVEEYSNVMADMMTQGGIAHFDDAQVKTTNVAANASGVTSIFTQNEELLFSGLKSMPSVQGRCLDPETKITMSDGSTKLLKDVETGDWLLGFDEHPVGHRRKWRATKVLNTWSVTRESVRLILDDGSSVVASTEHPFLLCRRVKAQAFQHCRDAASQVANKKGYGVELVPYQRTSSATYWAGAGSIDIGDVICCITSSIDYQDQQTVRLGHGRQVVGVQRVGRRQLIDITTTESTFVGDGLLTHNSYSSTETYAGVAYDIIIRNTVSYQNAVKYMIEAGFWLMASLWGENPSTISLEFIPNKTLHRLDEAKAEDLEIRNAMMLWVMGILDQMGVSHRLGFNDPATTLDTAPSADPIFGGGSGSSSGDGGDNPPSAGDRGGSGRGVGRTFDMELALAEVRTAAESYIRDNFAELASASASE